MRRPPLFQQLLHLGSVERAELVNEPDSGVELRKTSYALLDAGHADENHSSCAFIEDGAHLFETVHLQPIRLVNEDQRRWIWNGLLTRLIEFKSLEVGWVDRRPVARRASGFVQDFFPLRFVAKAYGIKHLLGFPAERARRDAH